VTIDRIADLRVIDADSHVVEPPDLWTSRMSSKFGDLVPHVVFNEARGLEMWRIGDHDVSPVGGPAMAGWHEWPPSHPPRFEDADRATWEASARLARMDEYGIWAEILYPNVALFQTALIQSMEERDAMLATMQAYNDFQTEWSSAAPERLIPMASLPIWDLGATLVEIDRCAAMGHRGLIFSQEPGNYGMPALVDRHWDPLWAKAQEAGLSINFHVGSGDAQGEAIFKQILSAAGSADGGVRPLWASFAPQNFLTNCRTLSNVICSGICHRFPRLNFVSVESGVGWVPFALDSLDWMWKNFGVTLEHPEYDLLPSEYFERQIYACFWFEGAGVRYAIDRLGADNLLYETDFPHPTSMTPGPASAALAPAEFIRSTLLDLDEPVLRKLVHENAAALYRL
jgi:predicted TIM-barrel fold metal-dependent hydrolase